MIANVNSVKIQQCCWIFAWPSGCFHWTCVKIHWCSWNFVCPFVCIILNPCQNSLLLLEFFLASWVVLLNPCQNWLVLPFCLAFLGAFMSPIQNSPMLLEFCGPFGCFYKTMSKFSSDAGILSVLFRCFCKIQNSLVLLEFWLGAYVLLISPCQNSPVLLELEKRKHTDIYWGCIKVTLFLCLHLKHVFSHCLCVLWLHALVNIVVVNDAVTEKKKKMLSYDVNTGNIGYIATSSAEGMLVWHRIAQQDNLWCYVIWPASGVMFPSWQHINGWCLLMCTK